MPQLGWNKPEKVDKRDILMSKAFHMLSAAPLKRNFNPFYRFWNWLVRLFKRRPDLPMDASKLWGTVVQLDQGNTPHCVGFASTHFLDAEPHPDRLDQYWAHDLYYLCKQFDGEPNEENGTTIHSAAKSLQRVNKIGTYVWARTLDDVKQWVLNHSPVIVGTDWYSSMFSTDDDGYVYVDGSIEGGHAYLILGYDVPTDTFFMQNSWGRGWGVGGRFKMKASEWEKLFDTYAEACATTEIPLSLIK